MREELCKIMDIPYLAKNEYFVVEGIAQGNSKKARKAAESRTVMIQTEEKEDKWMNKI